MSLETDCGLCDFDIHRTLIVRCINEEGGIFQLISRDWIRVNIIRFVRLLGIIFCVC